MHHWILGLFLLAIASAPAAAAPLSMDEAELAAGTDMAACKEAGKQAIARIGRQAAGELPASVFGEDDSGLIAAVHCLPHHGIAMIGIAGTSSEATRPVLAALLAAMKGQ